MPHDTFGLMVDSPLTTRLPGIARTWRLPESAVAAYPRRIDVAPAIGAIATMAAGEDVPHRPN